MRLATTILILMLSLVSKAQITGSMIVCAGAVVTYTDVNTGGTWFVSLPSRLSIDTVTGIAVGHGGGSNSIYYRYAHTDSNATGYCVTYITDTLRSVISYAPVPLIRYAGVGQTSITVPLSSPHISLTTIGVYSSWCISDSLGWSVTAVNPVAITMIPLIAETTIVTATNAQGCSTNLSVTVTP